MSRVGAMLGVLVATATGLAACGEELTCGEGTYTFGEVCAGPPPAEENEGRQTWSSEEEAFMEALARAPRCQRRPGRTQVDFVNRCAEGLCGGEPFSKYEELFGTTRPCEVQFDQYLCSPFRGLRFTFSGPVGDPTRPPSEATATGLDLYYPYEGTSPEGLGVDASLSCFVEDLGPPRSFVLEQDPGGVYLTDVAWTGLGAIDLAGFTDDDPTGLAGWIWMAP